MLVGALGCVCLVLQQVLVSLHLVLSCHVLSGDLTEHVHSYAGDSHASAEHRHSQEHSRHDDSDDDHRPHPIEDHLEQLGGPAVPPTLLHVAIALAPAAHEVVVLDPPTREHPCFEDCAPRPPPPTQAAAPRAPPIVV